MSFRCQHIPAILTSLSRSDDAFFDLSFSSGAKGASLHTRHQDAWWKGDWPGDNYIVLEGPETKGSNGTYLIDCMNRGDDKYRKLRTIRLGKRTLRCRPFNLHDDQKINIKRHLFFPVDLRYYTQFVGRCPRDDEDGNNDIRDARPHYGGKDQDPHWSDSEVDEVYKQRRQLTEQETEKRSAAYKEDIELRRSNMERTAKGVAVRKVDVPAELNARKSSSMRDPRSKKRTLIQGSRWKRSLTPVKDNVEAAKVDEGDVIVIDDSDDWDEIG